MAAKFIITISRQFGSNGRLIGQGVAEKLGIKYYDRDLISLAAKESGYTEKIFENTDEKPSNSLLYSIVMGSYATKGWFYQNEDIYSSDKLFAIQAEVIRKVAAESCVIVGRCADFVLRDEPGLLTVFTHAPFEYRKANVRKENPTLTEKELEQYIRRTDKRRESYYNYYSNREWLNPLNYHLSIDSSAIGVEGAAELIVKMLEIKSK